MKIATREVYLSCRSVNGAQASTASGVFHYSLGSLSSQAGLMVLESWACQVTCDIYGVETGSLNRELLLFDSLCNVNLGLKSI